MKKYFYGLVIFLFIGITMQSCKEGKNAPSLEKQTTQQEANTASWNQVQQQLNALDMSYGLTKNIRRAPGLPGNIDQVPYHNNWELADMGFSWGHVIVEDAIGAAEGASRGYEYGGKWGALIGGVILGGLYSIQAYIEENGAQVAINPSSPFVYSLTGNRFSDGATAPIGSEIGDLHNCLVSEMLQDANFMALTSLEDMFDYMCIANITSLSGYFTSSQIAELQAYLADNRTNILDSIDWSTQMIAQGYVDELNIIKHYAYMVSQTSIPFDMEQYTSDFMQLVDDAYTNNQISEKSALLINGTISTMYCSKTAWNYIQPDPYQCTRYILHGENMWYLADSQEEAEAIMNTEVSIDFVGYPYIENGVIKRVYIYANSSYNVALSGSFMQSLLQDVTFANTSNVVWSNTGTYYISMGTFPIYPSSGYADYVYVDFEH